MIAIMGAMDEEISVILSEMSDVSTVIISDYIFYTAKFENKDVVVVKCGIGMVNAAIVSTLLKEKFNVDYLIFSGVAGSTSKKVKAKEIVIGDSFVQYGFDVTAFNYEKGQRAGTKKRDIDPDYKMLELTKDINIGIETHYGKIGSSDVFVDSYNQKKLLSNDFDIIAVDMESAAVAHVCEVFKIPYLIIRSISDSLEDNSQVEFNELKYIASKNSKEYVLEVLKRL